MSKTLTAAAVLVLIAALLSGVAAARSVSMKERVSITHTGNTFVLTPMSSGAVRHDSGRFSACCWSNLHIVRAGQRLDLNNPLLTLTGKNGILKLRNRIVWVDVPGGWSIFTGTWKVVGGTGTYMGLSGHGSVAAAVPPSGGDGRVHFWGFLSK